MVVVPLTLSVPLSVSDAPANVPLTVGACSVGLVASTTLPLPVVAALEGVPEICEYATCAHVGPSLVSPVSYWPVEQELVPAFAVRLESNTPLSCSWPEVPV